MAKKKKNIVKTYEFGQLNVTLEDENESEESDEQEFDENDEPIAFGSVIDIEDKEPNAPIARGEWGHELDFLFACISVSVGLGNVWRFPYLCYKNGGGAFLIVYFIAMIFCGIPMFFQEVAIGQYLGSGGMTLVAQFCPILKGVGIACMVLLFLLDIYYCVIIAWTFFYLIATFTALPGLPWDTCDGWWNTELCYKVTDNLTNLATNVTSLTKTTPVEEFWENRVLQQNAGLEHGLGGFQFELVGCLLLSWVVVYAIISKGLHSSGKIIWFTALFPYAVMAVLLVRAVTLEGAMTGLAYYVHVDWSKLLEGSTWIDGATQIFFAYSIGMGSLPALGSYNKFHHNCVRDAFITCVVNTLTCLLAGVLVFSILGYMAHIQETSIHDVVNSGPGLVYLTYPDLVLSLPCSPLWAFIFFIMLLILGVDSEFCAVEGLVTGIVDNWPDKLLKHRKKFTVGLCIVLFSLGLPMCTNGGVYLFQLMDFYSCSGMALLWVCFFQTVVIGWVFGAEKFSDCVEQMTGVRPNMFWILCWKYFAPAVMLAVFVFYVMSYQPVTYGKNYTYPAWAEGLGLCISFSSMVWVPAYAVWYLLTQPGSLLQNLRTGMIPNITLRPEAMEAQKLQKKKLGDAVSMLNLIDKKKAGMKVSESGVGLLNRNESEYDLGQE